MTENINPTMPPYEKEAVFAEEVEYLIERFCREYQMTYSQIIGVLAIEQQKMIMESLEESEEDDEENEHA